MATHSSTLAWKIAWAEEPGRLQSVGSLRVRHDWATSRSCFTFMIGEGNGNPLQCPFLENPRDGGAWWAAVYGVAQSQTRLKRLCSSSSSIAHTQCCIAENSISWSPLHMALKPVTVSKSIQVDMEMSNDLSRRWIIQVEQPPHIWHSLSPVKAKVFDRLVYE